MTWARGCALGALVALAACSPGPTTHAREPGMCAATPKVATAAPTTPPIMKHRDIHGIPFGFESVGDGVPIVFLHGNPTDHRSMSGRFEPVFASMPSGSWRRIYPDLPGFGASPSRPAITNVEAYVEEIAAFIDAETGGRPFVLVGSSLGSYLSIVYTKKHADRLVGLALLVPTVFRTKPADRQVLFEEHGVYDGENAATVGALRAAATVHSVAVRDAIKRDVLPGREKIDQEWIQRVMSERPSFQDELAQLRFDRPSLVMTGRQDALVGYTDGLNLAATFTRGTIVLLDRAAHALSSEQRELFELHTKEWLARVREGMGAPYGEVGR